MENYSSAELSHYQLEAQLKNDAEKGMMVTTTLPEAVREFGEKNVYVAAMGAKRTSTLQRWARSPNPTAMLDRCMTPRAA